MKKHICFAMVLAWMGLIGFTAVGKAGDLEVEWKMVSPYPCLTFATYQQYYPGTFNMGLYANKSDALADYNRVKTENGWYGYFYNANFPTNCNGGYLMVLWPSQHKAYKWFYPNENFPAMQQWLFPAANEFEVVDDLDRGLDPVAERTYCPKNDPSQKGDPVSIVNGNLYESATDVTVACGGLPPLVLERFYNSRRSSDIGVGHGWTHSYSARLIPGLFRFAYAYVKVIDPSGRGVYFREDGDGYSGLYGETSRLEKSAGEYVWYRLDGSRMVFFLNGLLSRIVDPGGNVRQLTYHADSRLHSVTDTVSGRMMTFGYDANDRIMQVNGPVTPGVPDGVWVRYGYDPEGNLATVTYADGSGFAYRYDEKYNLAEKKNTAGHLLAGWTYDGVDRVVQSFTRDGQGFSTDYSDPMNPRVTDAYGVTQVYKLAVINGRKRLTQIDGPAGCTRCGAEIRRVAYDDLGRIAEIEYAGGRIKRFEDYDEKGDFRRVVDGAGTPMAQTRTYTYHSETGAVMTVTRPSVLGEGSAVTTYDFDNDGNTVANEAPTLRVHRKIECGYTTDETGNVISYEYVTAYQYDHAGRLVSVDGPLPGTGDTTTFAYDAVQGNLFSMNRPVVGATTFAGYDGAGKPGTVTDPNGNTTTFAYDGRGRIVSVFDPAGEQTRMAYNTAGEISSVILPGGVRSDFVYDSAFGRMIRVVDGIGNAVEYDYDGLGNVAAVAYRNPSNEKTYWMRYDHFGPDRPGELYRMIHPDDFYDEYVYAPSGKLSRHTDANGKSTGYDYDLFFRLAAVTQADGAVTRYGYDLRGNLVSVTDAEGHVTEYTCDDLQRVVEACSPDRGVTRYAYDAAGNQVARMDANGHRVSCTYDLLSRLTSQQFDDPAQDIFYAYDEGVNGIGRLTGMNGPGGPETFSYDMQGRLIRQTRTVGEWVFETGYTHDGAGQLTGVLYPDGRRVQYRRDGAGRIVSVSAISNEGQEEILADGIAYLPFGPLRKMQLGCGQSVTKTFDPAYRLAGMLSGSEYDLQYARDPVGNITSIADLNYPDHDQQFAYDDQDRLVSSTGVSGTVQYSYDRVGNRLMKNHNGQVDMYTYEEGTNRLIQVAGANPAVFATDAAGNTIAAGGRSFAYNQNNRLVQAMEDGAMSGAYQYNGRGQRVSKTAGGVETFYFYDREGRLIAEIDRAGEIRKTYYYLEGGLLAARIHGVEEIQVALSVTPDAINTKSKGLLISAYISFPPEFSAADVDADSIRFNGRVPADRIELIHHNGGESLDLMVKFDREEVTGTLTPGETVEVAVTGLVAGTVFRGADTVKVLGMEKKATTAAPSPDFTNENLRKPAGMYFYHLDHLGTPMMMADEAGNPAWMADYLPFGKAIVDPNSTVENFFRFPGQYYDAETGLHYNCNRYYHTETGRYLTPDPIGLAGGMNLYVYVRGNPVNWMDPEGLEVRVYSSDAFGIRGLNHAFVYSTETGRGKGTAGSSWVTRGDGIGDLTSPYNVALLPPGLSETDFMDRIESAKGWNNWIWTPLANDCHSDLKNAFNQADVPYPGAPNGRMDFDDNIKIKFDKILSHLDQLNDPRYLCHIFGGFY